MSFIETEHGFPSIVGIMGNTFIPLTSRLIMQGRDYFSRKLNYALTTLVVIDYQGQFLYVHVGYTNFHTIVKCFKIQDYG
jgi:hypothetical protein